MLIKHTTNTDADRPDQHELPSTLQLFYRHDGSDRCSPVKVNDRNLGGDLVYSWDMSILTLYKPKYILNCILTLELM